MTEQIIDKRADLKDCYGKRKVGHINGRTRELDKTLLISGNNQLSRGVNNAESINLSGTGACTCIW
jgi:hypothetical protein